MDEGLDLAGDALKFGEVGPRHLDADGCFDASGQHVDAGLDGHRPCVGQTGDLHGSVHGRDELINGAAAMGGDLAGRVLDVDRGPLRLRLEHDGSLDHVHRRRVGGGFRPTHLAEDLLHLGKGPNHLVRLLEHLPGLGRRYPRKRRRHVEEVAFVERRHELRAKILVREDPPEACGEILHATLGKVRNDKRVPGAKHPGNNHARTDDHGPAESDDEVDKRMIAPDEKAVQRVLLLGWDFAADEPAHENGRQRDRKRGGGGHRIGLRERERFEHPALLRLEREHGQERHRDYEQGVEQRRPDLDGGVANDVPMGFLPGVALQVLVGVFDHDDHGVHHRADGDGNAAERHDVRAEALRVHDDERHQHRDRQDDDRDEGAPKMQQKNQADQRHHQALLQELALERFDRAVDQGGAVVDDGVLHALGQALHGLIQPGLDGLDDLPRVHAIAHHHDPADRLTLAIQLGDAATHVGADLDVGDFAQKNGRASRAATDRNLAKILDAFRVTEDAEHEFLLSHLDRAATHLTVAPLHGHRDVADGEIVGVQAVRIDGDLVLLHISAHRRHLGDALDAGELVTQEPVLHRAQLGQVVFLRIERIHEGPADAGGVRTKVRSHVLGQGAGESTEVFQHAAAGPIGLGAVRENHINEGVSVKRISAHDLGRRHREHLGRDGIGHLVLHNLRRLAGPLGVDDDLGVGQVGDGIERNGLQRIPAPQDYCDGGRNDDELVLQGKIDEPCEHAMEALRTVGGLPGAGLTCRLPLGCLIGCGRGRTGWSLNFLATIGHGGTIEGVLEFSGALQPTTGADARGHRALEDVPAGRVVQVILANEIGHSGAEVREVSPRCLEVAAIG